MGEFIGEVAENASNGETGEEEGEFALWKRPFFGQVGNDRPDYALEETIDPKYIAVDPQINQRVGHSVLHIVIYNIFDIQIN